jgi:pimeloyl-ACP methyl ester carboxylesterase
MQSIILIPGLLCDSAVWEYQIKKLKNLANITVADLTNTSTPNQMVDAVLKHAPARFALAGHSMGGWVALELMRNHANRVTKLLLANTTAKLDSPKKALARNQLLKLAHENNKNEIVNRLLDKFLFQRKYEASVREMLIRNFDGFIHQENAMQKRMDCVPILKTIQCPTLIIHSNQDAIFDIQDSELLNNLISHSTLERIDQCGHMSPIEAKIAVTNLMKRWLQAD